MLLFRAAGRWIQGRAPLDLGPSCRWIRLFNAMKRKRRPRREAGPAHEIAGSVPKAGLASLETSRRGILRRGFGVPRADAALVTWFALHLDNPLASTHLEPVVMPASFRTARDTPWSPVRSGK